MRQDVFRKQWDCILCDAISKKASDIHLEPLCGQATITYQLRFRIHGILRVVDAFDEQCGSLLIDWLKKLSGLNIADRELPQDGRLTAGNADFRVSILPCLGGEKAVLRVLRKHHRPKLHELNLPIEAEQALRKVLMEKSGLIVIAGATGSGKTTTIHALLSELDSTKTNIMSLEDPVEYRFNGLSQIQISKHITFATGLRALLRKRIIITFFYPQI